MRETSLCLNPNPLTPSPRDRDPRAPFPVSEPRANSRSRVSSARLGSCDGYNRFFPQCNLALALSYEPPEPSVVLITAGSESAGRMHWMLGWIVTVGCKNTSRGRASRSNFPHLKIYITLRSLLSSTPYNFFHFYSMWSALADLAAHLLRHFVL